MSKLKIEISPEGFVGPDQKPRFKVKKLQKVEFKLVDDAKPQNVVFASGNPFGTGDVIAVDASGSGELQVQETSLAQTYPMSLPDTLAAVQTGKVGDLEVEP